MSSHRSFASHGVESCEEVKAMYLEPDGKISVIRSE